MTRKDEIAQRIAEHGTPLDSTGQVQIKRCGFCGQVNLTERYVAVVDEEKLDYFGVCPACDQQLCTCDVCSRWKLVYPNVDRSAKSGRCWAPIPRAVNDTDSDDAEAAAQGWCRVGFEQARPLTLVEVAQRLGWKDEDDEERE